MISVLFNHRSNSTLIDEVGQMPGALPLLSFALSELYIKLHQRWKMSGSTDRSLTLEDYTELGGVAGSLTRRATDEYDKLIKDKDTSNEHQGGFGAEEGKAHQITMRRVMLRMVAIEGGGVARRQVPETELIYTNPEENGRVERILDRLVHARLLVKGQEAEKSYVEPAHDFLVHGWEKLQKWIEDEKANLTLQQRLTPAANDWDKNEQDTEYLWIRDPRLALLEKVLESETNNWLNQLEEKFVEASKQKRIDELEETKRQLKISEERRVKAELREKAARSLNLLPTQPLEGLLLAIEAIGQNLEVLPLEILSQIQDSLLNSLDISREKNFFISQYQDVSLPVHSVDFGKNDELIFAGIDRVFLWEPNKDKALSVEIPGYCSSAYPVFFDAKNNPLVFGHHPNHTIKLWLLSSSSQLVEQTLEIRQGKISSIAFNESFEIIVVGNSSGTIWIIDNQGNILNDLFHPGGVTAIAISPVQQLIATAGTDDTIRLWKMKGEVTEESLIAHHAPISSISFNHESSMLVSGGFDCAIYLWERRSNRFWTQPGFPVYQDAPITKVTFSPDSQLIASTGADYTVRLWTLEGKPFIQPLRGHRRVITDLSFSSKGQVLASSSGGESRIGDSSVSDTSIRLWDLKDSLLVEEHSLTNLIFLYALGFIGNQPVILAKKNTLTGWYNLDGQLSSAEIQVDASSLSYDFSLIQKQHNIIQSWDMEGHQFIFPQSSDSYFESVIFLNNGHLLTLEQGSKVYFRNSDGQITKSLFHGDNKVKNINAIAVNTSETLIATGGIDGRIHLWDREGMLARESFGAQVEDGVKSIAFSPNGNLIACGYASGNIRFWDLDGNRVGNAFGNHHGWVVFLAFSPDGHSLVSASRFESDPHKKICIWKASAKEWLRSACDRLRYHPVFKNPQTETEKAACETCRKYVWDISDITLDSNEV